MTIQNPLEHPRVLEALAHSYARGRFDQFVRTNLEQEGHVVFDDAFAARVLAGRVHTSDFAALFDAMAGIDIPRPASQQLPEAA